MALLGFLKNFTDRAFYKEFSPGVFASFFAKTMPQMGEHDFPKAYRGIVFACINAVAEDVANIELTLQNKVGDDWKAVPYHPAMDVLKFVNPFWSSYDLMYDTCGWLKLHGNAFWCFVRNGNGQVIEIWPLNPINTYVVRDAKSYIKGYVFKNDKGQEIPFDPEDILHFKRWNPKTPFRGMGEIEAASIQIDIDSYAAQWQRNFFTNSAMPSGVLSTTGTLNQDQYDRIRANWKEKYTGVQNAHRLAIMEGGLTYTQLTPNQRDMQFSEGRKDIRDEIMAVFRTPKTVLGITEDVNRANAEASEYVFGKRVVLPMMKLITTKLNEFYLPLWKLDPNKYRMVFANPVPENVEQQATIRNSEVAGSIKTINEARAEINLEPVENGDELLVSTMLVPLSQSIAPPEVSPTEEPETDPNIDEENQAAEDDKKKAVGKKKYAQRLFVKKVVKAEPKIIHPEDKEYIAGTTLELFKTYDDLNHQLEVQLLANLKNKKSLKALKKDGTSADLVRLVWDNYDKWVGLVYNSSKAALATIMLDTGTKFLTDVGVNTSFDLKNPRASDWLNEHALEDSNSYSGTIKEEITLRVLDGINTGDTVDNIAGNIKEFLSGNAQKNAMRIARTETMNAYNAGDLEGAKQSDVVSGKSWFPDAEACDICKANEGDGVIALDDEFSSGDTQPTAHPNCECTLQFEVAKDV